MDEAILKAAQTADLLESDMLELFKQADCLHRPEGRTIGVKATLIVVSRLIRQVREVQSNLADLS